MRKCSFVLAVVLMIFTSCRAPLTDNTNVEYASASAYNDYIATRQMKAVEMILRFNKVFRTDIKTAEKVIDSSINEFRQIVDDIGNMPDWKGDTVLREKAIQLQQYYKKAFEQDYKRLIVIMKDASVSWTESAEIDQMIKRQNISTEKLLAGYRNAQSVFASANNLVITLDEEQKNLQRKIDETHSNQ